MKVTYSALGGRITFSDDAASPKAAFEFLASVQESFEDSACGHCGSESLRFEVREYPGVTGQFFKLVCRDCHAQLDFGQNKDGRGLFAKRRDEDGHPLPDRGFYHYRRPPSPDPGPTEPAQAAPAAPTAQHPTAAARPVQGQPGASKPRPRTGPELLVRLCDYEGRLVEAGYLKPGELLRAIITAGNKAGHGKDIATWSADAVELALKAVEEYKSRWLSEPAA